MMDDDNQARRLCRAAIEPTDAELATFGLTRDDLPGLPLSTTAIHIKGEEGLRFSGAIHDERGKREIEGTLPYMLVEAPEGDMFIDLRTINGEVAEWYIEAGRIDLMTQSERMVVYLSGDHKERGITAVPLWVEDVESFVKRDR